MSHDHHAHAHSKHHHGHRHGAGASGAHWLAAVVLNVMFTVIEAGVGVVEDSTALLADAAHNLGDVLGLLLAWGAAVLATRPPSGRWTYGLRRSTVLAGLANAGLVYLAVGAVSWEAITRLGEAPHVDGLVVLCVAGLGLVVNTFAGWLLARGRGDDVNVRAAALHLFADAAVSGGVVVAGALMMVTDWEWLDPLTSLLVSVVVLLSTYGILRDATHLVLDAVPSRVDIEAVREYLVALPTVREVHDLHIWAMSTTEVALTAHLCVPWNECAPEFLKGIAESLRERFAIGHVTLQLEPDDAEERCRQGKGGNV